MRGVGRAIFVAILLMIAGTLNIIYGIGAIGDANFYTSQGVHYVFGSVHTWGWVTLILGVFELTAGLSLFGGGTYGRVMGIAAASIGAIGAILAVTGPNPWWALCVFAICVMCIHGLVVLGEPEETR